MIDTAVQTQARVPRARTKTPSLRRRLVAAGVAIVLMMTVALDVLLYVSLRSELLANLPQGTATQVALAEVHASLRQLLALEALVTVLAGCLAAVLLGWVADMALRPVENMLGVIRRQTAGQRGERIQPDTCECLMGELGRAYDEMLDSQEQAIRETQAARDRSRRFLANAADQLRTPIAAIHACTETLLRRSRSRGDDEEQLLSDMLQETRRVGRLVHELLQAARADQGMDLIPVPCDLPALCRHETERLQRLEPSLSVTHEAQGWDGRLPLLDSKAVHDIVANLLDNARRHAVSHITVSVATVGGSVELRVADDGSGLSEEAATMVFERFVSLDGAGGSGLGLPIAQELARAHGGDLTYSDHAFVVSLPAGLDQPLRPAVAGAGAAGQPERVGVF